MTDTKYSVSVCSLSKTIGTKKKFIVTLFVTTNSWEKIKYPSIGEWIKKNWWCSYTMKYQSEIKGTNY